MKYEKNHTQFTLKMNHFTDDESLHSEQRKTHNITESIHIPRYNMYVIFNVCLPIYYVSFAKQ